jgi:hypothetical protein
MFLVCVTWYASASRSGASYVEQDRVETHFANAELQVGYLLPGMDFVSADGSLLPLAKFGASIDRPGLHAFRNSRVVRRPADVVLHVEPFGSEQIFSWPDVANAKAAICFRLV